MARSLPTQDNIEKSGCICPEWGQNPQSYNNEALDRKPTVIGKVYTPTQNFI